MSKSSTPKPYLKHIGHKFDRIAADRFTEGAQAAYVQDIDTGKEKDLSEFGIHGLLKISEQYIYDLPPAQTMEALKRRAKDGYTLPKEIQNCYLDLYSLLQLLDYMNIEDGQKPETIETRPKKTTLERFPPIKKGFLKPPSSDDPFNPEI